MSQAKTRQSGNFPFVKEVVTDTDGKVRKVIPSVEDYQRLVSALEDEGLYKAISEVRHETPLNMQAALKLLEDDELSDTDES